MPQFVQTFFGKLPAYWKLSTIRCAIYALIVGWGVFKAGTNGFDSLANMTKLQVLDLAGDSVIAMLTVWIAFLDNTIQKVQSDDTTFFQKPISPATPPADSSAAKPINR